MVRIEKRFVRKKPLTTLAITELGRERTARHWEQLEALRDQAVSRLAGLPEGAALGRVLARAAGVVRRALAAVVPEPA